MKISLSTILALALALIPEAIAAAGGPSQTTYEAISSTVFDGIDDIAGDPVPRNDLDLWLQATYKLIADAWPAKAVVTGATGATGTTIA